MTARRRRFDRSVAARQAPLPAAVMIIHLEAAQRPS
jgi:hypothetical protein